MSKNIEVYKWEKQDAIIIKNCANESYSEIFQKNTTPYKQITDSGASSSDFSIWSDADNYDFEIRCPLICKEYRIIVPKGEIKLIDLTQPKVLFDFLTYIEGFNEKAKNSIYKIIKKEYYV